MPTSARSTGGTNAGSCPASRWSPPASAAGDRVVGPSPQAPALVVIQPNSPTGGRQGLAGDLAQLLVEVVFDKLPGSRRRVGFHLVSEDPEHGSEPSVVLILVVTQLLVDHVNNVLGHVDAYCSFASRAAA